MTNGTIASPLDEGVRAHRFPIAISWRMGIALLGLFAFVVGVAAMDAAPIGAAVDDAMYVILGKSLATGQGYRSLNLPEAPYNTHFPPGYPAVLAVLWRIAPSFPANLLLFRLFNILCVAVGAGAAAHFIASRGVGRGWALGVGALSAISVPVLVLGNLLLSEPLFLALLLLLLTSLERFVDPDRLRVPLPVWRAATLGLCIGVCMLVRTHGIVLVPAMVITLGVQRRWRDAAVVASCAMLVLLPWQIFSARHAGVLPTPLLGGYDSYTAWWLRGLRSVGWNMIPRTLARTVPEVGGMFGILFSPARGSLGHAAALLALGALAAAGVVAAWRRIPVTLLFIAGYLTIVAVWPFQPGRFVWGIWPLLLTLLALGGRAVFAEGARWHPGIRIVLLASLCWVGVGNATYEARAIRNRWWSSIPRSATDHIAFAVNWTRANTALDDIVATEDEGPVFLYTGRRTIPVHAFTVMQYLGDTTVDAHAKEGLIPLLRKYPARAVIVYTKAGRLIGNHLSAPPDPLLAPRGEYPGGSAYSVLHR